MSAMILWIGAVWKSYQIFWQATVWVYNNKAKSVEIRDKEQTQTQLQQNYTQHASSTMIIVFCKPYKHMTPSHYIFKVLSSFCFFFCCRNVFSTSSFFNCLLIMNLLHLIYSYTFHTKGTISQYLVNKVCLWFPFVRISFDNIGSRV